MTIKVKYFASLHEEAHKREEEIVEVYSDSLELYTFLQKKYKFSLKVSEIKVAINGEYEEFETKLKNGDIVTFIPPVAGG